MDHSNLGAGRGPGALAAGPAPAPLCCLPAGQHREPCAGASAPEAPGLLRATRQGLRPARGTGLWAPVGAAWRLWPSVDGGLGRPVPPVSDFPGQRLPETWKGDPHRVPRPWPHLPWGQVDGGWLRVNPPCVQHIDPGWPIPPTAERCPNPARPQQPVSHPASCPSVGTHSGQQAAWTSFDCLPDHPGARRVLAWWPL